MFLIFSISFIGHTLAHRIISSLARRFAFSHSLKRFLVVANLALICFFAMTSGSTLMLWLFIGILLLSLKFFPTILRIFLQRRLKLALIPLLDCTVLGLQTGKSFRSSLHLAIENQQGWIRQQLTELYQSMAMSENVIPLKSALLNDLRREFVEIDRSKSRCLEQVQALRREIKMQEDFRRRSGQVTQQIKMQALIVTALYLALLFFVITQFGFVAHKNLIVTSILVFILGLVWIFFAGRRIKWKV